MCGILVFNILKKMCGTKVLSFLCKYGVAKFLRHYDIMRRSRILWYCELIYYTNVLNIVEIMCGNKFFSFLQILFNIKILSI